MNNTHYKVGCVGRELTYNIPVVGPHESIATIAASIHIFAKKFDSINYIYVVDTEQKLLGVVSVKELLRDEGHKLISELMNRDLVVTHVQVNRKRAAHLAIKHNIKAIPVLDTDGKFAGVLNSDKMLAILYEEHRIEAYRSAGISSLPGRFSTILDQGIWHAFLSRLPWIVIGLVGGMFAAHLIKFFEFTLSDNIILAAFIPLIVYIGNAVGVQVQTFFVRDIAFNPKLALTKYAVKQIATSAMIGIVCGLLIWVLLTLFWQLSFIGFVIGLAIFSAVFVSTIIAIIIPYLFSLLQQDPASGSGPFATILQDLFSILVYFSIASILL